jgi:hypothetical protein
MRAVGLAAGCVSMLSADAAQRRSRPPAVRSLGGAHMHDDGLRLGRELPQPLRGGHEYQCGCAEAHGRQSQQTVYMYVARTHDRPCELVHDVQHDGAQLLAGALGRDAQPL